MIVIDANVAAKWLLPEPGSEAAIELQEGPHQLFAPDLIRLEVAAALTRRVRADKDSLPAEEVLGRYRKWLGLLDQAVITLIPESELLDHAAQLSTRIKHSLQDCMYLAAAQTLNVPIITADEPFEKRAKTFYKRISLLPGCSTN
jgi:predicted nucleic acid-binding protein